MHHAGDDGRKIRRRFDVCLLDRRHRKIDRWRVEYIRLGKDSIDEAPRATVVVTCTAPAAPPPAMAASDHFIHGLMSPNIAAVVIVPATTAAGAAMVSKALSSQGM